MTRPTTPEHMQGYLVLADISGFDAYLAGVELEHANDIMTELLELIAASLRPPMTIAGVRADAVLGFASAVTLTRGESLLELTEVTYVAFRDRLKSIARNNTCGCRACAAVPTLDLKFLVHFGEFTAQPGPNEQVALLGLDANLVSERLLKEQAELGSRSYVLLTEACLKQMAIRPAVMAEQSGTYPHIGVIRSGSLDLSERYDVLRSESATVLSAEEADLTVSHDFGAETAILWDWLNDPFKRSRWLRWTTWKPGIRPGGRTGVGAVNHCAHGVGSMIETILDWRPYDYFTVRMAQDSLWLTLLATYRLESIAGGGTRLTLHARIERAPIAFLTGPVMRPILASKLKQDFVRMAQLMGA